MFYLFVDDQANDRSKSAAEAFRNNHNSTETKVGSLNTHGLVSEEELLKIERETFSQNRGSPYEEEQARIVHRYTERVREMHNIIKSSDKIIALRQGLGNYISQTTGFQGKTIEISLPERTYKNRPALTQKLQEKLSED